VTTETENSTPSSEGAAEPSPTPQVSSAHVAILAAIRAFAVILSARLLLFLALAGAFALAVMSEAAPSVLNLLTLISYCVLTILPLVALDHTSRRRPGG
jgi:hypothetical protein